MSATQQASLIIERDDHYQRHHGDARCRSALSAQGKWAWLSLIPMGLGAWAPIYAGVVVKKLQWCVLGAVWSTLVLAGWVLANANNGRGSAAGMLVIVGWIGGVISSFCIRAYEKLLESRDLGLVDVNNASAAVLANLPGVDDELASRIIEARAMKDGFSSIEDLGITLDLDGPWVEDLRSGVVFLPR